MNKRPPLGIMPRNLFEESRYDLINSPIELLNADLCRWMDLQSCIERNREDGGYVSYSWIIEWSNIKNDRLYHSIARQ